MSHHESFNKTEDKLKELKIKIVKDIKYTRKDLSPSYLNSRYIAYMLNTAKDETHMVMNSNINSTKSIPAKGRILLYGICELQNCKIMLFSTRSKAIIITPLGKKCDDFPCYYILEHKDSYVATTTYYSLKSFGEYAPTIKQILPADGVVAVKYKDGEVKGKEERHKLGKAIDDIALQLIKQETFKLYDLKWNNYVRVHGRKASEEAFRGTLSTKSLPTGVVKEVKAAIEKMLKEGKIANKSEQDIPKSAMWMSTKVGTLTKAKKLSINGLLEEYFNKRQTDQQIKDVDMDSDEDELEEESLQNPAPVVIASTNNYRTIGKTLKGVINPKFDFSVLAGGLDELQASCNSCMNGLSAAVGALLHLIVSGKFNKGTEPKRFFDLKDVDFNNNGIGQGEQDLFILNDETKKWLENEQVFSFLGFWNLLSHCVGGKSKKKDSE